VQPIVGAFQQFPANAKRHRGVSGTTCPASFNRKKAADKNQGKQKNNLTNAWHRVNSQLTIQL